MSAEGIGPSRRRIGRRDELGHDIGRSAKGRIVEPSYIFFDRPAGRFWWQPLSRSIPFCRLTSAFDQTGIDRKGFPPTGPSGMQRRRTVSKTRRRRKRRSAPRGPTESSVRFEQLCCLCG